MFAMQRSSLKSLLAALAAALTLVSGMSARAAIDVSQSPLFLLRQSIRIFFCAG